jgi:hypothetical protein
MTEASRSDRRIERAAAGPNEATKVPCEQQLLFTDPSLSVRDCVRGRAVLQTTWP